MAKTKWAQWYGTPCTSQSPTTGSPRTAGCMLGVQQWGHLTNVVCGTLPEGSSTCPEGWLTRVMSSASGGGCGATPEDSNTEERRDHGVTDPAPHYHHSITTCLAASSMHVNAWFVRIWWWINNISVLWQYCAISIFINIINKQANSIYTPSLLPSCPLCIAMLCWHCYLHPNGD